MKRFLNRPAAEKTTETRVKPKKVSYFRLAGHYLSIAVRSTMEYRASFLLALTGQFAGAFLSFLTVYFMFQRFRAVEGFTYDEVLLCFSTVLMAFSLAETFMRGLDHFQSVISNGEFDRILVRPRSPIFQAAASHVDLSRLGRLIEAVFALVIALGRTSIVFTPDRILCLALMIICGAVLFSGVFVIYAFFCFFTTEGLEFMNIFTDGVREHGRYPFSIYGRGVMAVMTYVVPFTLVQYYPFLYLTGRSVRLIHLLMPVLSMVFLLPCALLWKLGVRRYRSTGS